MPEFPMASNRLKRMHIKYPNPALDLKNETEKKKKEKDGGWEETLDWKRGRRWKAPRRFQNRIGGDRSGHQRMRICFWALGSFSSRLLSASAAFVSSRRPEPCPRIRRPSPPSLSQLRSGFFPASKPRPSRPGNLAFDVSFAVRGRGFWTN